MFAGAGTGRVSKDSLGSKSESVSGKSFSCMEGTDRADETKDGVEETGSNSIHCESMGASS